MQYLSLLGTGLLVFISTDIDDYLLLVVLLADRRLSARQVLLGQYIGFASLLAAGLAGSCLAFVIPARWLGLLGIWPFLIGLHRLFDRRNGSDTEATPPATASTRNTLAVTLVTIANGGDNVSAYVPLFAWQTTAQKMLLVSEFLLLIGVWYMAARFLVIHPIIGGAVRRMAITILPYVLMGLGLWILLRSFCVAAAIA